MEDVQSMDHRGSTHKHDIAQAGTGILRPQLLRHPCIPPRAAAQVLPFCHTHHFANTLIFFLLECFSSSRRASNSAPAALRHWGHAAAPKGATSLPGDRLAHPQR